MNLRKLHEFFYLFLRVHRFFVHLCCRSPHGERGLKFKSGMTEEQKKKVAPLTGSVD